MEQRNEQQLIVFEAMDLEKPIDVLYKDDTLNEKRLNKLWYDTTHSCNGSRLGCPHSGTRGVSQYNYDT